jgi:starvation-inducible DNA-binding protein
MKGQLNAIGLPEEKTSELVKGLSDLLANYSVFYQNVRGFHWNIKGDKFFELHLKFEELYDDLRIKIDELAERILTLGGVPDHAYSLYLKQSEVIETALVTAGKEAIGGVLESFQTILIKQRAVLDLSGDLGDEGTNALMSDYIREQEKLVWMYRAYMA